VSALGKDIRVTKYGLDGSTGFFPSKRDAVTRTPSPFQVYTEALLIVGL
jgi:hypothetical protein